MVIVYGEVRDAPEVKAFRTYLNYLDAYRRSVRTLYVDWPGYLSACLAASASLQGRKSNQVWIERYLPIAWNTEHLIHQAPRDNPSLLRIANHWLPIQTYYAIYCGAEAVGSVLDGSPPDGHAAALRSVTAYLIKAGTAPWNLGVEGALGRHEDEARARNLPAGTRVPHNLECDTEPLGMLAKCLLTEHKHRVGERWESRARSGCFKYQFDPGTTGFLHFLYRLRVKANYRDVDLFLAAVGDHEVLRFTDALRTITNTGLTLCEVLIMRRMGKRYLLDLGKSYLRRNPNAEQLSTRLDAYHSAF